MQAIVMINAVKSALGAWSGVVRHNYVYSKLSHMPEVTSLPVPHVESVTPVMRCLSACDLIEVQWPSSPSYIHSEWLTFALNWMHIISSCSINNLVIIMVWFILLSLCFTRVYLLTCQIESLWLTLNLCRHSLPGEVTKLQTIST